MHIRSPQELPTLDEVRAVYDYNPETGQFFDKRKPRYHNKRTYRDTLYIPGHPVLRANRVAWFLFYGQWPPTNLFVDHINGEVRDNRISNLRLLTPSDNNRNTWRYRRKTTKDLTELGLIES